MDVNLVGLMEQIGSEDDARAFLESLRWPEGAVCPRCGADKPYTLKGKEGSKSPVRKGVYKCRQCRKQFTVTVGTIFEDSHIPLSKWLLAIHLMCASKKGISAHQLHRMLGLAYKSAWFMCHRIRYAMSRPPLVDKLSGIVEADETLIGGKPRAGDVKSRKDARMWAERKPKVLSLVERGGDVRSMVIPRVTAENLRGILLSHVDTGARLMTDGWRPYRKVDRKNAIPLMVFDQGDALFGKDANAAESRLTDDPDDPMLGEHCLRTLLPDEAVGYLGDWADRIRAIPDSLIDQRCHSAAIEEAVSPAEADAATRFLIHRKSRITDLLLADEHTLPHVQQRIFGWT